MLLVEVLPHLTFGAVLLLAVVAEELLRERIEREVVGDRWPLVPSPDLPSSFFLSFVFIHVQEMLPHVASAFALLGAEIAGELSGSAVDGDFRR